MVAEVTAWAAVGIGAGSLLVAVAALIKSNRTQSAVNALQQRSIEIEEQRDERQLSLSRQASLKAELRKTARNSTRLYIINSGEAEASNIRVEMDGQPLAQHSAAVSNDDMPQSVGPNSEIGCFLAIASGIGPPFNVEVTWDDAYAGSRTYFTTLTW